MNGELHYLTDQCGEEGIIMNEVIAGNFITLLKASVFAEACQGGHCTIDNVEVECGEQTGTRRRRGIQTSKVPLTVYFDLKVPLPSNASLVDLNQTTLQISNDILAALNKTDLNLNISGIVLEYDTSKPPVFRFVRLVCDDGQVVRGTKCGK